MRTKRAAACHSTVKDQLSLKLQLPGHIMSGSAANTYIKSFLWLLGGVEVFAVHVLLVDLFVP